MREITTVLSDQAYLECPRWHEGRIWVSDFYTHQVLSALEDGSDVRVEAEVPGQPSGLEWLPDGRLLVVSQHDSRLLRREPDGSLATHADLSACVTGEPNDMVVDRQGRAFVGSFGFDLFGGAPVAPTSVHRVDPTGRSPGSPTTSGSPTAVSSPTTTSTSSTRRSATASARSTSRRTAP